MNDSEYMRYAIALCKEKMDAGVGGYCASIVVRNGEVIGRGWNNVIEENDPTGHCEINAIRDACGRVGDWNLSGSTLYTTWEPCAMCAAAIWWARIDRVFYANLLSDATRLGMDIGDLNEEVATPSELRRRPYRRLLGDEAFAVVEAWWNKQERDLI